MIPHQMKAYTHGPAVGCPNGFGRHIYVVCSCGLQVTVPSGDDIAAAVRRHGGTWVKHDLKTA